MSSLPALSCEAMQAPSKRWMLRDVAMTPISLVHFQLQRDMLQEEAMSEKCPIVSVMVNIKICTKRIGKDLPSVPVCALVKWKQEGVSVARHNISLQRTARPGFHGMRIGTSALGRRPKSEILQELAL